MPLLNDLGIVAHWRIISRDVGFFEISKKIHNGLQSGSQGLTESERETYLGTSRRNAELRGRFRLFARSATGRYLGSAP